MKVYAISGLGADKRVFQYLKLNQEILHLDWIQPLKSESITAYAHRLSAKIDTREEFCLIGVSFGGLIAKEISLFLNPKLTILISSASKSMELPRIYKTFGLKHLIKIIPRRFFKPPIAVAKFLFGTTKTQLLKDILNDTNLIFAKWAVTKLVSWENNHNARNLYRIHGTNDKLIPAKGNYRIDLIKNGEHFMIVDKSKEVSILIQKRINLFINKNYK
ncbi:alpha/beta hydrolase [Maribacter sp. 2210JD10-5]|uniref:alpha/beta hydrolase n=1 Tax=Maribacter sp. 2210JD10-5 TaxID=3386272 RepID=UPI0039BD2EFC